MSAIGYVNSMRLIKTIKPELDYIEIEISHLVYNMFGNFNEYFVLLNKDVLYDTRKDMYEGVPIEVIASIADKHVIKTVEKKKSGVKLLPDTKCYRDGCNLDLSTLRSGDRIKDCIVYLSSCTVDRSSKARWLNLSVLDMVSKVYIIKYFLTFTETMEDDADVVKGMVGHLIKIDLDCRDSYGFSSTRIECLMDEVQESDEVAIAYSIISEAVEEDTELKEYVRQNKLLDTLRGVIDIEPGYHLVRMATELLLAESLGNISNTIDAKRLVRAIVTSRGYLLSETGNYSKPTMNIIKVMRTKSLLADEELRIILDIMSPKSTPTKRAFIEISNMAKYLILEKRGLIKDEEIANGINDISNRFGGLL